jgi:hypothetical protein
MVQCVAIIKINQPTEVSTMFEKLKFNDMTDLEITFAGMSDYFYAPDKVVADWDDNSVLMVMPRREKIKITRDCEPELYQYNDTIYIQFYKDDEVVTIKIGQKEAFAVEVEDPEKLAHHIAKLTIGADA